jgi:hypothetical protein
LSEPRGSTEIDMTHTDTDGLLNACGQCGARAGFEVSEERPHVRARCTECCNCSEWYHLKDKDIAITTWNQSQLSNGSVSGA